MISKSNNCLIIGVTLTIVVAKRMEIKSYNFRCRSLVELYNCLVSVGHFQACLKAN